MTHIDLKPRLVVAGADRAIDFYRNAFDAELVSRYTGPDGSVVHAELCIGERSITVKDEDDVDRSTAAFGGSPVLFMLDVHDPDAVAAALEAAGANVIFPVQDSDYGRGGRLEDPFGFQWMVMRPAETESEGA